MGSILTHTEPDLQIEFLGDATMKADANGNPIFVVGNTNVMEAITSALGVRTGGSRMGVLQVSFTAITTPLIVSSQHMDGHFAAPNENPRAVVAPVTNS